MRVSVTTPLESHAFAPWEYLSATLSHHRSMMTASPTCAAIRWLNDQKVDFRVEWTSRIDPGYSDGLEDRTHYIFVVIPSVDDAVMFRLCHPTMMRVDDLCHEEAS